MLGEWLVVAHGRARRRHHALAFEGFAIDDVVETKDNLPGVWEDGDL